MIYIACMVSYINQVSRIGAWTKWSTFADDNFKDIFWKENYCTLIQNSLKSVPIVSIDSNMMMSSDGKIFRVTGPLWRESTGHRWIPLTKASDVELGCFLEQTVFLNKRLSKQSRCRWFETPSRTLLCHCNEGSLAPNWYQNTIWINAVYCLISVTRPR